jgi:hypothetical protein
MPNKPLAQRFWEKVAIGPASACWEWQATRRNGYGRFKVGGRLVSAHRLAYELHHGPIPRGVIVRHSCHNPSCCNPSHLRLGSQKDNVHDMIAAGRYRGAKGEAHGKAKLTAAKVRDMRALHQSGMSYQQLSEMTSVHKSTVGRIITRKTWKHI